MAVRYEARDQPCIRCGDIVSIKVIEPNVPRNESEPQRKAIHDGDGTPADARCGRGPS
jgi:hypothetical protein